MLNPMAKLWLKKGKISVIGEGRAQLLKAVQKQGSITKAAHSMGMSYRHAWGIINHIQTLLGEQVVTTSRGGPTGGGAKLTSLGEELLKLYEEHEHEIHKLLKYGPRPAVTVDGVVLDKDDKLVLIRRRNPPFKGKLALPGGFVEYNETTEDAIIREVKEELGVKTRIKEIIGVYSNPNRDPRQHTISVVYELEPLSINFKAGDDAETYEIISIDELSEIKDLAFDHALIISDFLGKK